MKKYISLFLFASFLIFGLNAQSDDDLFGGADDFISSDDSMFGGDEDIFSSDDDLFSDDSIQTVNDVSAKSDLSKGVIFDTGSIKIGGSLTAGISTSTVLYSEEENDLGDNIHNTKLSPDLSAMLSVDARPTDILRIYSKFGFAYPFQNKVFTTLKYTPVALNLSPIGLGKYSLPLATSAESSIVDWFKLKELFTDFSMYDRAFFRFGIHTVSWGTGYFFSPVSDMINSSSIDPENPTEQVDGSLNLRTQLVFPGTQNCLWFYVIPSTNFKGQTADSYARETALAGKFDFLIGNWEAGIGGLWKYNSAPKGMLTLSGSFKKLNIFSEFVYSYGALEEWGKNNDWDDKTSIFQATAGFLYIWKDPGISLAAQYYFNSNDIDSPQKNIIYGHNIAGTLSFSELFGNKDFSANLFCMSNIGRKDYKKEEIELMKLMGLSKSEIDSISGYTLTSSLMAYYTPIKYMKFGMGPTVNFKDFESKPTVSFKISASLGGGKF